MGTLDQHIGWTAARQHSLLTRSQLHALGLSDRQIDVRVACGRLVTVHRGVYRVAGVAPYFQQQVLAACLATGGVASHRSAAALFHLRGIEPGPIEICVEGRASKLEGIVSHTVTRLERTMIGVIPVTMPMQTLLHLAAVEPRLVEGALASAFVRKLVALPTLVRYLQGVGRSGRDGTARLRELVEEYVKGAKPTESWLEDRLVEFIRQQGLPEPERQYRLTLPGRRRIRLDCAYPEYQAGFEADGRLWHTSPSQRRRDAERDQAARVIGWSVDRITWLELTEEPEQVRARIAARIEVKRAA
jgi:very-short-patch-repair endonuclease